MRPWCVTFSALFLCSLILGASPSQIMAQNVSHEELVTALIQHESGGNDKAIGDKHLTNKAYGCLQVRQACLDDVNRRFNTRYRAEDCLGNRQLSLWVFNKYMEIYATVERLGRKPTAKDKARIWNGGLTGCFDGGAVNKKGDCPKNTRVRRSVAKVQKNSLAYWQKVRKILEA